MITEKDILKVTNTQFDKYSFQTSEGILIITEHDFNYLVEELVKNLTIPDVRLSLDSQEIVRKMKELSEGSKWKGKRHKEAISYGFVKGVDWAKEKIRKLNEA